MRLSIIIPCHNAAPWLAQTIGSALDQRRPPDEVIVIDDASTDDSAAIAERFAARDRRVHAVSRGYANAPATRNFGAAMATGDALMFLDADDVLAPSALAALVAAVETSPGGVAACPWRRLEQADGRWVARPATCVPRTVRRDPLSAWLLGWYHPPCSVLWSRDAFSRTGGWDPLATVNNDGDVMMRALAVGVPLVETRDGLAYYRRLPGDTASLSDRRQTPAGITGRLRVLRKLTEWLAESGRLHAHAAAVADAMSAVADDARPISAELAASIDREAAAYAPRWERRLSDVARAAWRRPRQAAGLALHRLRGAATDKGPEAGAAAQVSHGIDHAQRLLALAATTPPQTPPAPPAVSVIVPTYNRAGRLVRAIDSVLAQTFEDFELLIVDDASTDDTAEVVGGYGDRRVRFLPAAVNRGVSTARNRGVRAARGELIAFLDSDDTWSPDKLAAQVDVMRQGPWSLGLVYAGVERLRGDGGSEAHLPEHRGDVFEVMLRKNVIYGGGSNVMIRRGVVATAGFFDTRLPAIEDYDYWLRVARWFEVDAVGRPLCRYHDAGDVGRRSRRAGSNLTARDRFLVKHGGAMRAAGVTTGFLGESLWRAVEAGLTGEARRLAARAFLTAPRSPATRNGLRKAYLPNGGRRLPRDLASAVAAAFSGRRDGR